MDRYEKEKRLAAKEAIKYVKDGMILGIGSGTTVKYFIEYLAECVGNGLQIKAVPTSLASEKLCQQYHIPLCKKDETEANIDVTVDGADEFDLSLNLIKGGGGALLREKVVASATALEIIISDSRKKVQTLGTTFPLPVEVLPFALHSVQYKLNELQIEASLRTENNVPYVTDQGNYILDCHTGPIRDLYQMVQTLNHIPGILEHGIFINMADVVIEAVNDTIHTYDCQHPAITLEVQKKTMHQILEKMQCSRKKGEVPVVELDLDLTTFVPKERTIQALQHAGNIFQIKEFKQPSFTYLPGYTREAWVNFISQNNLTHKYPHLRWLGEKDGKDGDSVYSVFHTWFWKTELLALDTLTPGLKSFIQTIIDMGGKVVFVSGRWKEEQIEPTLKVLEKEGLQDIPLMIGNPRHDGENPISDSQIKALHQEYIREKYGVPIVFIDDRSNNRDAVIEANKGIEMLSIGCAIPGFTFDQETSGIELKISNFMM